MSGPVQEPVQVTCSVCGRTGRTDPGTIPEDATYAVCPDCEDTHGAVLVAAGHERVGEGDVVEDPVRGCVCDAGPQTPPAGHSLACPERNPPPVPDPVPRPVPIYLDWYAREIPPDPEIIPGWYVVAYDTEQDLTDAATQPRISLYVANVEGGAAAAATFASDLAGMLNEHAAVALREGDLPNPSPPGGEPSPIEGAADGRPAQQ